MLHFQTVGKLLKNSLDILMSAEQFKNFRLVGGTSLSLQIGHRLSVDIDLFTDEQYGSIDFDSIEAFLQENFEFVSSFQTPEPGIGRSYSIGNEETDSLKLDVFYTDAFIQPAIIVENIRLATIEEIIAMKLEVINNIGRKKDFWDIHELLDSHKVSDMLSLHKRRYPYHHDRANILQNFTDFSLADDDFDPVCLKGKHWEFIKEDITEAVQVFMSQ